MIKDRAVMWKLYYEGVRATGTDLRAPFVEQARKQAQEGTGVPWFGGTPSPDQREEVDALTDFYHCLKVAAHVLGVPTNQIMGVKVYPRHKDPYIALPTPDRVFKAAASLVPPQHRGPPKQRRRRR